MYIYTKKIKMLMSLRKSFPAVHKSRPFQPFSPLGLILIITPELNYIFIYLLIIYNTNFSMVWFIINKVTYTYLEY